MEKVQAKTFKEALQAGMEAGNFTMRDLATAAGLTYEHVRSVLRGYIIPSVEAAKALGAVIGMDPNEAAKLVIDDHIRLKYGKEIAQFSGKNPELAPIELCWHRLSGEQKRVVIQLVELMAAKHNTKRSTTTI